MKTEKALNFTQRWFFQGQHLHIYQLHLQGETKV